MSRWKAHEKLRFMAIFAELSRKKRRQEKLKNELTCAMHTAKATCLQLMRLIDLIYQYQQIVCCVSCCNFCPHQNLLNAVGVKDCSVLITFAVLWVSLVICALSYQARLIFEPHIDCSPSVSHLSFLSTSQSVLHQNLHKYCVPACRSTSKERP